MYTTKYYKITGSEGGFLFHQQVKREGRELLGPRAKLVSNPDSNRSHTWNFTVAADYVYDKLNQGAKQKSFSALHFI